MKKVAAAMCLALCWTNTCLCESYSLSKWWAESFPFFAHHVGVDLETLRNGTEIRTVDNLVSLLGAGRETPQGVLIRRQASIDEVVKMDFPLLVLRPETNEFFVLLGICRKDGVDEPLLQVGKGDMPPELHRVSEFARLFNNNILDICSFASRKGGCRYALGQSEITVDRLCYNFGYLKRGKQGYVASFALSNEGARPVFIGNPQTSCSCTVLSSHIKNVLQPGESQVIQVRVSAPKGGSNGFLHKVLVSFTGSQGDVRRDVQLYVTGNIEEAPIQTIPDQLDFGDVLQRKQYTRTVRLTGMQGMEFRILGVEAADPSIKAAVTSAQRNNGICEYLISVTLTDWTSTSEARTTVAITTDHPLQELIEVPVKARGLSSVIVVPPKIVWTNVKPGQTATKTIQLRHRENLPIRIVDISATRSTTVDLLEQKSDGSTKTFQLTGHFSQAGVLQEDIRFVVQMGEVSEAVTVPIYSLVKKGD